MTVGLTLGKYAPLHRGHQLVIETALRETDHLIVLIYPAAEAGVPLPRRAEWIRRLYPSVEVIEAWDGPTIVGMTPEITRLHDDYLTSRLGRRGVTHFFSSEPYGEHVSRALGAVDRRVDEVRQRVPVSATAIRRDPFEHRHFVDPLVYGDLITRVAIVGAPSTGKTTLAAALAARFDTVWMPEYGREYWDAHQVNRRLRREELVHIAEEHRRREDELVLEANRVLFVDTEAIVTRNHARYYHGGADPRLERLADESGTRYDLFLLCDDDIPYDDTADRDGEANRSMMQAWMREELTRRAIPFVTVRGTVEERLDLVRTALASFRRPADPRS